MKKLYPALLLCAAFCFAAKGQTFSLIKDINPAGNADPRYLTDVNGILFFRASNGVNGIELWKSNGTNAGTVMIKDINLTGDSHPQYLININGSVFFRANNGVNGTELWKSDGSEAGTVMVKDIKPGLGDSDPFNFFRYNNTLYFSANDGTNGNELWKSDGTEAGTVLVKDINPGSASGFPLSLVELNGMIYFSAINTAVNRELWKTDGTAAGTVMVKDIIPGTEGSFAGGIGIVKMNGMLYFPAVGAPAQSLWKSDGTEAGTVEVKSGGMPEWMAVSNGTLFYAGGSMTGTELWKSDGTTAGTVLVKEINLSGSSYPNRLTDVNGKLYFLANTGSGYRLWKSDGTEVGTVMIKDMSMSTGGLQNAFVHVNGLIYCTGADANGAEIWKSDGTESGTVMVQDIAVPGDADPWEFMLSGSKLYTSVINNTTGRELWAANMPSQGALPLSLLDFKAQLAGNDGLLQWKTSFEQSTSHFEIERSTNKRNFVKVGTMTAAGTSSIETKYNHSDRNITSLNTPVVYYRLKMMDVDGKSTYSKIIAIVINSVESIAMLYPNPAGATITLMIAAARNEKISYSILDALGKTLQINNVNVNQGSNSITVETGRLASGVYSIAVNGASINSTIKFIKQ